MAEFNVTPRAEQPQAYIGYSRGIETSVRNDALGDLFSAAGNFGAQMVETADNHVKNDILDQIHEETELIQNEFGVGDATLQESDAEGAQPLPAALQSAGENLNRLAAANEQGVLKESHYWARLNSMVRQLRGKYPGYRDEIDQMVASITGARPANALRASLFDEWSASQANKNSMNTFIEKVANETGLPADFDIRMGNGDPYSYEELRSWWANKNKERWEHQSRMDEMAARSSMNNLTTADAVRTFRQDANQQVLTTLFDLNTTFGKDYRAISGQIDSAQAAIAAGGLPENVEQIKAGVANLRFNLEEQLNLLGAQPFGEGGSASYLDYVPVDQMKAIKEEALAPIRLLEDALANENFGLAKSTAAWIEAMKNQTTAELIRDVPAVATLNSLREMGGDVGANLFIQLTPEIQSALAKSILDTHHAKSAIGGHSVVESFTEGEAKDLGPEYYNGIVDSWVNTVDAMAKGGVPLAMFQNKVDSMFGPKSMEVLQHLDDSSRFQYFAKVASPAVSKNMIKLLEAGDVDSWENYQQWVSRNFMVLFKSKVDSMQDASTAILTQRKVVWDEKNAGFRLLHEPVISTIPFASGMQYAIDIIPLKNELDQLNAAIRTVRPIIEYNDGRMGPEIYEMLNAMGFDPTTQDTFWGGMMKVLEQTFNHEPEKVPGGGGDTSASDE